MKNVLLIFIRNPELGKVKTRLALSVGAEEALRIYRVLLEKTREAALGAAAERHLYYTDYIGQDDGWPGNLFDKRIQSSGDLGARMEAAFRTAFEEGAGKVVVIGSDCPELDRTLLEDAFDLLDQHDFVLGPTYDGGYYLLGMHAMEAAVFRDMNWSTATVRAETLDKIAEAGKTCGLLPTLNDIDEVEDWAAYLDGGPIL